MVDRAVNLRASDQTRRLLGEFSVFSLRFSVEASQGKAGFSLNPHLSTLNGTRPYFL